MYVTKQDLVIFSVVLYRGTFIVFSSLSHEGGRCLHSGALAFDLGSAGVLL